MTLSPPGGRTCSVPDCNNRHKGLGYCDKYYLRIRNTGTTEAAVTTQKVCSAFDCNRTARTKELCEKHYMRLLRTGSTEPRIRLARPTPLCDHCGSPRGKSAKKYCSLSCAAKAKSRQSSEERMKRVCEVEGCNEPTPRGLICNMHRLRKSRWGTTGPAGPIRRDVDKDIIEHVQSRSIVDPQTGCWRWMGSKSRGYGTVRVKGSLRKVHNIAYECFVGEVPEGLVLDHVYELGCRYRDCWNPGHLEPVTQSENVRRGWQVRA